jgi:hypothetical protein
MSNYYDFLGLKGYRACHEYHYKEETCGYRKLFHYYVQHFNKLIQKDEVNFKGVIP